ncbi:MAG: AAA family ATPase [Burkholderiaceae bacterium]|jgi:cellulose biosynthesis protein BcsQ|nr:AAA family ATPase [Burkholderiaceae bacterium]
MSIPTLTFFNNKGGVGKTTLVYHLSWMFAELGLTVLVVDCDPQANLTTAFQDDETLLSLWEPAPDATPATIFQAIKPLMEVSDISPVHIQQIAPRLHLIAGDLGLSAFEDHLSEQWGKALSEDSVKRAMLVLSAFWRVAQTAGARLCAQLIIFDVGPNLGAINRSALISSDYVLVPLAADLFSLQGLRNLGPALEKWRNGWKERLKRMGDIATPLPAGHAKPIGYVALQHQERLSRPVQAYVAWLERIPNEYRRQLLGEKRRLRSFPSIEDDENCLALLRHYKSLIPLAQEARKPIFKLRAADGAIGSHATAVARAYKDFDTLAHRILERIGIPVPASL